MANEKVLLVDDEADFVEILAKRLKARNLDVLTASNGEDAIKLAGQHRFDAVILDLQMPGMDGIETLRQLIRDDPDQQVLLLTGHGTIEKGVEAVKEGAVDFLQKPIDIKELMEKIGRAATEHTVLVERRSFEKIEDILEEKGW